MYANQALMRVGCSLDIDGDVDDKLRLGLSEDARRLFDMAMESFEFKRMMQLYTGHCQYCRHAVCSFVAPTHCARLQLLYDTLLQSNQ